MKPALSSILLIDDSMADNLFHSIIIEESNVNKKVTQVRNGLEAIEFLESSRTEDIPNLIFLDYNMPKMNGPEFLEAYEKLQLDRKEDIKIILLTTSLSPFDMKKVSQIKTIDLLKIKPLTGGMLCEIVDEYFSLAS